MTDQKKDVLIIDDDTDILVFLTDLLESGAFGALTSDNGQDGLKVARDKQPGLILLDIMMPDMDGHAVCKALKADQTTSGIPVLMITAKNDVVDVGMSLDEGAEGFVAKPFDTEHFLRLIEAKLGGEATAFYANYNRLEIPAEQQGTPKDGDRIAFVDLLEPQADQSVVIEASETPGTQLMSLFQLPRDGGRLETTALVICESGDCFGQVVNTLVASPGVEILGCRVYDDLSHIPVDIMDTPDS